MGHLPPGYARSSVSTLALPADHPHPLGTGSHAQNPKITSSERLLTKSKSLRQSAPLPHTDNPDNPHPSLQHLHLRIDILLSSPVYILDEKIQLQRFSIQNPAHICSDPYNHRHCSQLLRHHRIRTNRVNSRKFLTFWNQLHSAVLLQSYLQRTHNLLGPAGPADSLPQPPLHLPILQLPLLRLEEPVLGRPTPLKTRFRRYSALSKRIRSVRTLQTSPIGYVEQR